MPTPGITTRLPLSAPSIPALATSSAVDQMNEGPGVLSFLKPPASRNSVATGPGQSAVIVTPVPFSSADTASLKLRTNAFVAA